MNDARRKEIKQIMESLSSAKAAIEDILSEEEDQRDNMSEEMQDSVEYEASDEACDNLEYAIDDLEQVLSSLEEASV